jgi:hypothetical protein
MSHPHQAQDQAQQHKRGSRPDYGGGQTAGKVRRRTQPARLRGRAHMNGPQLKATGPRSHTPTTATTVMAAPLVQGEDSRAPSVRCRPTLHGWATTIRMVPDMIAARHNAGHLVDALAFQAGHACVDGLMSSNWRVGVRMVFHLSGRQLLGSFAVQLGAGEA